MNDGHLHRETAAAKNADELHKAGNDDKVCCAGERSDDKSLRDKQHRVVVQENEALQIMAAYLGEACARSGSSG